VDDLSTRLLTAIEETERLAGYRDDDWRTDPDSWHTRSCGYGQGELMDDCGCEVPAAVLRRCAADRTLVEIAAHSLTAPGSKAAATLARIVIRQLAEGYGLSDREEGGGE
jgi:hypothetical protein